MNGVKLLYFSWDGFIAVVFFCWEDGDEPRSGCGYGAQICLFVPFLFLPIRGPLLALWDLLIRHYEGLFVWFKVLNMV